MDKKHQKNKSSTNNTKTIDINIKNNKQNSEKIIYFPKQISQNQKQFLNPLPYEKPKTSEILLSPQSSSKPMKSERKSILSKVIFLDKNKQYMNINPNLGIKSKLIDKANLIGINDNDNDNKIRSENEIYVNYTSYKHNNNLNTNQIINDGNSLMLNTNMIYKRKKSKDHYVQKSEKRRYMCNTPVANEKVKTKIVFDNISEDDNNKMTIQIPEKGNYLVRGFSVGNNLYQHKTKSFISPTINKHNAIIKTPDMHLYNNETNHTLLVEDKQQNCNNEQFSTVNDNLYIQNNNKSNFIIVNHDQKETNIKSYSDSKLNINKNTGQNSSVSILNNNKGSSYKKSKRDYDFLAPVVKISLDLDKEELIQQKEDNIDNNKIITKNTMNTINQFNSESTNVITKGVPDLSLLSTNRTDNLTNIPTETHKPSNKIQKQNQLRINKDEIQIASSLTITPHHTSHKFFPHKAPLTPSSSSSNTNNSISNREFISFLRNGVHHKSIIPESLCNFPAQQEQSKRASFRNNAKNTSSFINDNLITINNFRHKVLNDFDKNNVYTLSPSQDLFSENKKEQNKNSDISNYNSNCIKKIENESNLTKLTNKEPHSISKIRSHFCSFSDKNSFNNLKQNFDFSGEQIERNNSCNKKYNLIYDYEKIGKELMDDVQKKSGVNRNNVNKKRIIASNSFVNQPQFKEIKQFELFNK